MTDILLFDKEHQLDKLRIFRDEIKRGLLDYASEYFTLHLMTKFGLEIDPLLVGGGYDLTLLQDYIGITNKDEMIKMLKDFKTYNADVVQLYLQSSHYTNVKTKWGLYIEAEGNNILHKDAWGRIIKYNLLNLFDLYIYKIADYFRIDIEELK